MSQIINKSFVFCRNNLHFDLASPVCIFSTRTGCIPHLTKETFDFLNENLVSNFYQLPVPTLIDFTDAIRCGGGAAESFSLPESSLTFASLQDFSCPVLSGYNTKKSVAMWRPAGKLNVTAEMYMKAIEDIQPDVYHLLADGDVVKSDSRKRVLKSMSRSLDFLEACVGFHKKSPRLKNCQFMCMIEGGSRTEERKHFINLMMEKLDKLQVEPWGYVIDGLSADQSFDSEAKSMIKSTVDCLPPGKPIAVHGFGHPCTIIEFIKCGVNMFDTAYITKLSEMNKALVYKIPQMTDAFNSLHKTEDRKSVSQFIETICLSDNSYSCEFVPIVNGCTCYTCTHHTRAYIHHLVAVKEMLAPVLLMLHNLHHHLSLFKTLRRVKTLEKLNDFQNHLIEINAS